MTTERCSRPECVAMREEVDRARACCTECHYTAWRVSAETGLVLYCEVCDQRSQTRDALSDARRFRSERDQLQQRLAAAEQRVRQLEAREADVERVALGFEQRNDASDLHRTLAARLRELVNEFKENARLSQTEDSQLAWAGAGASVRDAFRDLLTEADELNPPTKEPE